MTWELALSTLVALLGATGGVKIFDAILRRRAVRVEVADKVNEMTVEWASVVKADAAEARKEAAEARREAADARKEAADARREAADARREAEAAHRAVVDLHSQVDGLADRLRALRTAILLPETTIEHLRTMVPPASP